MFVGIDNIAERRTILKPSQVLEQQIQAARRVTFRVVGRFNRTVRHEWLDEHLFDSIGHAQRTATDWLWRYNNERPNMANGGITPIQKLALAA